MGFANQDEPVQNILICLTRVLMGWTIESMLLFKT